MNLSNHALLRVVLALFVLAPLSAVFAQSDPSQQFEPSYEIALHVVIGSNDGASKTDLPQGLSVISKYLKGNFTFSNYRLANTFLGRISNNGNIEYKGLSNLLGQETEPESQTFLEWSMGNFRSMPNGFQARSFRFGAKVPIRTGSVKDSAGNLN